VRLVGSSADEDLLRRIADGLPVGLWVATVPAGDMVYANVTFAEIMGMGARADVDAAAGYAQPYGIHTRDGALYPEDQLPFARVLRSGATVLVDDIVIHRRDGGKVAIRAQARPLFDAAGVMSHVVVAFIDITREVEEAARRRDTELRLARAQRMESIGQLAGGVAHDFNNLLAAIQVIASTMERSATAAQRTDLRRIEEVCASAVQLTRSLLGFAGQRDGRTGPVGVAEVAEAVAALLRRTFDRRIVIDVDLADTRAVIGDRGQLEQVIMNLAMNARDAMPEGGDLILRTRAQGDQVLLEVSDSGPGIDPALRERIFEPYFTTKTAGPVRGTGLGLATVYGIITSMQGTIGVHERAPRGTTFRIALPAVATVPARAGAPRTDHAVTRVGHETLLLAEDDPLVRGVLASALADLGYQVLEAADGREAVELFGRRHADIDAVVLDANMPRMDGRQAFLAMVGIDPGVRVLLTSGYLRDEDVAEVMALGVRRFLPKPYDLDRLSEAIGQVLADPGAGMLPA
jgi:signal transduction histidine kinase/ActR/RegA family two-component response regulator